MSCYIVVFEVSSVDKKKKVEDFLKKYGFYCPITEHCWALITEEKPTEIRDKIEKIAGADAPIFVVRSGTLSAWQNSYGPKFDDWLKKYL